MADGVAVVDKPAGWTSHDVVARARRLLGERRVGHSGTLDPDATGVLVLGVGRVTRLLRYVTGVDKAYEGEVVFGAETTTLDASGGVVRVHDMAALDPEAVEAAAGGLRGDLLQVPPMVSAVRVGGRRLHELARAGVDVEREARRVRVERFDVEPTADPLVYRFVVVCSSGTYVRVLAADLGHALGGGAHLRALRRTRVGAFGLDDAVALDELGPDRLLAPVEALRGWPRVTVDATVTGLVRHGRVLDADALGAAGSGPWAVVDGTGALLAVYERRGHQVKPTVVLAPA